MRILFNLILGLVIVTVYAQEKDSFVFLGNSFDLDWNKGHVKIDASFTASSNALNTGMYNDFLFNSSFSEESTKSFLANSISDGKLVAISKLGGEYKLNSNIAIQGGFNVFSGYNGNKKYLELAFYGNQELIDQQLSSDRLSFLSYRAAYAGLSYRLHHSEKRNVKVSLNAVGILDYGALNGSDVKFFTGVDGSVLNSSASRFSFTESSTSSLKGVGLSGGFNITQKVGNKHTLEISAEGLNITRMIEQTYINLDTSIQFSGFTYDFANDTVSINDLVDSTYGGIIPNRREDLDWVTLPSILRLDWRYKINNRATASLRGLAIDLGRYGWQAKAGIAYDFSTKFRLRSELGYGNFSGVVWDEAAEYRLKRSSVFLTIINLQSLIIPLETTTYGIQVGFSHQIFGV